jgi:hypothetical protein
MNKGKIINQLSIVPFFGKSPLAYSCYSISLFEINSSINKLVITTEKLNNRI